ncbi:aldo/keto reductase [Aciduricibacillus chroicocephali]|uniref:Aldo/keto reductase n=1 Tax=Aciduricibacillus chroicocephali TaxID=3054939 RepID=A0ABY9KUR1_9BACI|nr:aldo/keto reductase [Bacillaceae bacterium 44XB]
MKKNELGKSGIFTSELSLGCMSLGTDAKQAFRIIDAALDRGINHFDTADLYDFGKNEEILGKAIKNKRQQVVLTSKVGNDFSKGDGSYRWNPSHEHIITGLKASLKRLQTDYLDFYMLHGGTIDDPLDESIDAFETLKKEGLIRSYGISSIRPNVIREYVKRSTIDGVMMQYSMLDRRPEEEILDLLQEKNISVLARGPLAGGLLSNDWKHQLARKGTNGYLGYMPEELDSILPSIAELAQQPMNSFSFSYVLSHPAVATAVFGASSIEQLEQNTSALPSAPLGKTQLAELQKITKPLRYEQHR